MRSSSSAATGVHWFNRILDARALYEVGLTPSFLWRNLCLVTINFMYLGSVYLVSSYIGPVESDAQKLCAVLVGYSATVVFQTGIHLAGLLQLNSKSLVNSLVIMSASALIGVAASPLGAFGYGFVALGLGVPVFLIMTVSLLHYLSRKAWGERTLYASFTTMTRDLLVGAFLNAPNEKTSKRRLVVSIGLSLVAAPFALSTMLATWLAALVIRMGATLLYLREGLASISQNFSQTIFVTDLSSKTELVPGHPAYSSEDLAEKFESDDSVFGRVLGGVGWVVVVLASALYRLSIKSTCWLYWPLAYVMRSPRRAVRPALFLDELVHGAWSKTQRLMAWVMIAGFLIVNCAAGFIRQFQVGSPTVAETMEKLRQAAQIASPLEFLFLIDFNRVRLLTWFNLLSALITIVAFFYVAEWLQRRHAYAESHGDKPLLRSVERYVVSLERLALIRNVLSYSLIALVFLHALFEFTSIRSHLPIYMLSWLSWIYES